MDIYNHTLYGEMLVNSLKFYQDTEKQRLFLSPNSDSLLSISQRLSDINHPVLVAIDGKDADFDDTASDTLGKKSQYFFMLLQPAIADDPMDIMQRQEECERVAGQVQARMLKDCRQYAAGLTQLLQDTFVIRSIGPVGDNLYGVIMGFNVRINAPLAIDNTMWL